MDLVKERLKEQCLLFLFVLSSSKNCVNVNTFKRYLYLYYLSGKFFDENMDEVSISLDKGDIKILYFNPILDDFQNDDLIELKGNDIYISQDLIEFTSKYLDKEKVAKGKFYELYMTIKPFVNLLNSYDDQFVFTIFFSEPTFQEASERGLSELKSSSSRLSKLLSDFKAQITNTNIDDYDILTHWMDYVLKNYYN